MCYFLKMTYQSISSNISRYLGGAFDVESLVYNFLNLAIIVNVYDTSVDPNPRLYQAPRGIKSPVLHVGVL